MIRLKLGVTSHLPRLFTLSRSLLRLEHALQDLLPFFLSFWGGLQPVRCKKVGPVTPAFFDSFIASRSSGKPRFEDDSRRRTHCEKASFFRVCCDALANSDAVQSDSAVLCSLFGLHPRFPPLRYSRPSLPCLEIYVCKSTMLSGNPLHVNRQAYLY